MDGTDTRQLLAQITDTGRFEALATAVLREEDPDCRRVVHVGLNKEGKTVPSPVDGIAYICVDGERRMLAVHHTTCRRQELRRKWLSGPDSDLNKTLRELCRQRQENADLRATLVLTTNEDPTTQLVHDVERAGHKAEIEIRLWTGSALAHFLDFDPKGHWIRAIFLGVEPTQLSKDLFRDLSVRSVQSAPTAENPKLWVDRDVDEQLRRGIEHPVQFVLGDSGVGKTVACLMCLQRHVQMGGFGLVVTHDVLHSSGTVEEAVDCVLRKLQPTLVQDAGREALSLTSENEPLFLVIEDINRSAQPARLAEALAVWSANATRQKDRRRWRILCPIWPRTIALARDFVTTIANKSAVVITSFSKREGIAAVKRRRSDMTDLEAEAAASALGFDPLLIALHGDSDAAPEPRSVIETYIGRALGRRAASRVAHTAGEYLSALETLSLEMLKRRRLEPRFADVLEWTAHKPHVADMLRELAIAGDVVRLGGPTEDQFVVFRHDRVKDYVLAEAIAHAIAHGELLTSVMAEPYFAEVIGMAVARNRIASKTMDRLADVNPLALFCGLRHCSSPYTDGALGVVEAATRWADAGAWRSPLQKGLRAATLRVLSECDGQYVRELCEVLEDGVPDYWSLRGRFRNGDLGAGAQLCAWVPPGVTWAGHVELIDHVFRKNRPGFLRVMKNVLAREGLNETGRRGALRLAGFVGSSELAGVLRVSWKCDSSRLDLLSDYFWACARCCGNEPGTLLEPIVDAWAMMSDEDERHIGSPRVRFGADELRWAFRNKVPERAIGYLLQCAERPELRWPILVMLNGIDNPEAVEFVVRELAQRNEQAEATGSFLPFALMATDEWSEHRSGGRAMSTTSRDRLQELWLCNANGEHLRRQALRFWCTTVAGGDVPILRTIDTSSEIGSIALFERLRRGDRKAVPALVAKLDGDSSGYWWQAGRYLWTDELTDCLDRALARRADELTDPESDPEDDLDWILVERLVELPPSTSERLIAQNWGGLCRSANYVEAALHVASPGLLRSVSEVVAQRDDPRPLFKHLCLRLGLGTSGRRGLTRSSQMDGLLRYLDYLSESDIVLLWRACNENGWFEWRREHLDARAKETGTRFVDDATATKELDRDLDRKDRFSPLDHWGTAYLKTGVSVEHMMEVVAQWLEQQPQEKALLMAADLVTRFGKRRHLALLDRHTAATSRFGQEVIRNADFELRLRSLD